MSQPDHIDPIRQSLHDGLAAGPDAYLHALTRYWGKSVDVTHEPGFPQDGPMDIDAMQAERRALDSAFLGAMPDFHHADIWSRVVGDNIFLFCEQRGTLPDGARVSTPLCSRFTLDDGKIVRLLLHIDLGKSAALQAAFPKYRN